MRNVFLRRRHDADAPMPARRRTTNTPGWVKVAVVLIIILVLLFVILHLTGDGFDHLVRHRPVGLRLAAHRSCLVTLYQVGLVPLLLGSAETRDHHPYHPHLAGPHTANLS